MRDVDCMMCLAHITQGATVRENQSYISDGVTHAVSFGRRVKVGSRLELEAALTCTLIQTERPYNLGSYWATYGATWVPLT